MTGAPVLITGASDGIGRQLAVELARMGHRLGLLARRRELLEKVAEECQKQGAPQVEISAVDVTDNRAFRSSLEDLDRKLGGAAVLVANAGVALDSPSKRDCGDRARQVMSVNVIAAIDGLEWMKSKLISRGQRGQLVGVTSVAGARGLPASGLYCASKAALHAYLEALRADMRRYGIVVTDLAPGFIDTAMTRKNKFPMPWLMDVEKAGRLFARAIVARKPLYIRPWPYWPIFWFLRALPRRVFDPVNALLARFT